jgi:hypothetical protein
MNRTRNVGHFLLRMEGFFPEMGRNNPDRTVYLTYKINKYSKKFINGHPNIFLMTIHINEGGGAKEFL